MSHTCGRVSSEKRLKAFKPQSKTTDKRCCSVTTLTTDSKYFYHSNKTDGQHKIKRLKTRKERSQMRGGCKETLKTKPCHQHCHRQSRKDAAFLQNCCHNSYNWTSRRITPILSAVPAAREPSIITDSRLIGHHGLFNHEVKSIDIERLLSKQNKLEQSGQKVTEDNNNTSNLSSASHIPALLSGDGLLGADADDDEEPTSNKAGPVAKTQETDRKNLQGSEITPDQRPQQQIDHLSASFETILPSKHSPHSEDTNTKYFKPEKKRTRQLTPPDKDDVMTRNRKIITDPEQPHENQDPQTQADGLKPSPPQTSSSPTAESSDMQHRRPDPECVSKTITAVAERLCGSLRLSALKQSNLVAKKNRKLLLKSLQERHGPWLQANLLEVQRYVGCDINPTQAILDHQRMMEEDQILLAETSVQKTGSGHFTWEFSPQPHQSQQQIVEDLTSPMDTSVHCFDETFRPSLSRHFYTDLEPPGAATGDLFSPSSKLFQKEKVSSPELWEDFNSKSEEAVFFDSFPNSFMNHTRGGGDEMTFELQKDYIEIQPFPFQDGLSANPMQFPQEQDPFEPDIYSLPTQIHPHPQSSHFQPFDQLSTYPTFRSRGTDMMHYPPSHMLERSLTPPPSSLQSPEHWSFPPMRLY
ncbi:uncharacterized protein si:dkey-250k15.4 [Kryptolebias marmoratus]|uniref:uncharacterized protein si:dkey-250k15.4 n=1 Tax=Kryptolebias marmoratus TaxID=37003 RepID=UPI0007F92C4F|nr:uncharacterized protein si:dkey-250k15.4 [Kryptolebias marmoratus]